jgi:nickel transport protein
MIERAVARQVGPLREQLAGYEDTVRRHDVLGGLGYILGITGIACYLIARHNRQS